MSSIPPHVALQLTATTAAATSYTGPGGGWVPDFAEFCQVTSSSSAKFLILSDKFAIGQTVLLTVGSNGYKLGTPAGSSLTINNVDTSGATASAVIPANTTQEITRTLSTGFIMRSNTALGAVGTAIVPS
jgi:hypothetical protein